MFIATSWPFGPFWTYEVLCHNNSIYSRPDNIYGNSVCLNTQCNSFLFHNLIIILLSLITIVFNCSTVYGKMVSII